MMKVALVGAGRLGQILRRALPVARAISGRAALVGQVDEAIGDVDLVIHAAGPAGEAVAVRDPGLSFALHYTLTERLVAWLQRASHRRLVLLGTVAPNVGFYGPLKRAQIRMAQERLAEPGGPKAALTVIECGHVIGKEMSVHAAPGVVATFISQAVTDGVLQVPDVPVAIRVTPVAALVAALDRLVHIPAEFPPVLAPVSEPILLRDLAETIAQLADIIYNTRPTIVPTAAVASRASYTDPTGEVLPVPSLALTLQEWMRQVEVRMLFQPRRTR